MSLKKRVFSGMRPTGEMHVGNYFGALVNWAELQDEYECMYMVADIHALMSEYANPHKISTFIKYNIADWIASGIDPEKSIIFVQSTVPEHSELHLILSCITPLGWLERCPTYKEQVKELASKDVSNYAFLGYPVLQAADILLYKGDFVPVGEDQIPHLELAREIVRRFNKLYGGNFPEPQPKLTPTPRFLGIDGFKKMSKSYKNSIYLSDKDEIIRKKVESMFTDPTRIKLTDPGHPEICNVFRYYTVFFPSFDLYKECTSSKIGCTQCKKELAEKIIEFLKPIREKRNEILETPKKINEIIEKGSIKARTIAKETIRKVKELVKLNLSV